MSIQVSIIPSFSNIGFSIRLFIRIARYLASQAHLYVYTYVNAEYIYKTGFYNASK